MTNFVKRCLTSLLALALTTAMAVSASTAQPAESTDQPTEQLIREWTGDDLTALPFEEATKAAPYGEPIGLCADTEGYMMHNLNYRYQESCNATVRITVKIDNISPDATDTAPLFILEITNLDAGDQMIQSKTVTKADFAANETVVPFEKDPDGIYKHFEIQFEAQAGVQYQFRMISSGNGTVTVVDVLEHQTGNDSMVYFHWDSIALTTVPTMNGRLAEADGVAGRAYNYQDLSSPDNSDAGNGQEMGWLVYGDYVDDMTAGAYIYEFTFKCAAPFYAEQMTYFDATYDNGERVREVSGNYFMYTAHWLPAEKDADGYATYRLPFAIRGNDTYRLEGRVKAINSCNLFLKSIRLYKVIEEDSSAPASSQEPAESSSVSSATESSRPSESSSVSSASSDPSTTPSQPDDPDEYEYGDISKDHMIDPVDALMVLQSYTNSYTPDETERDLGDVDGLGGLDPVDAMLILQYYVGDITIFPRVDLVAPAPVPEVLEKFTGTKYYAQNLKTASTVYLIYGDGLSKAQRNLVQSLQGIVAQKSESQIFMCYRMLSDEVWVDALQEYYGIEFIEVKGVWDLVDRFKDQIGENGYVLYCDYDKAIIQSDEEKSSINTASVYAGVKNYLIVEESLEAQAIAAGLVKRADARDISQWDIFMEFEDQLNKQVIVSIGYDYAAGRDFGISQKCMFWHELGTSAGDTNMADFEDMLASLDPNGIILGWHNQEAQGVLTGTSYAYATVASDNSTNYTIYAGLENTKFIQTPSSVNEVIDSTQVHYVTMLMSDGDNIQYLETQFANNKKYWAAPNRGAIPFGWSFSPSLVEMSPLFINYYYSTATVNDQFFASVSGLGYMYPNHYGMNLTSDPDERAELLDEYYKRTAEYMEAMDLSTINIFEWDLDLSVEEKNELLSAYAKYDQIKGGFLTYSSYNYLKTDPTERGAVWWYNDKPFVNLRERDLVLPEADQFKPKTQAMRVKAMSELAHRLNHYTRNSKVIEGYSAINICPWDFTYNDCVELESMLDESVICTTPNEFIQLITDNVPHENVLHLTDPTSFDYSNMVWYVDKTALDLDKVGNKIASTQTTFTFDDPELGMEGWILLPGQGAADQAAYAQMNEEEKTFGAALVGTHGGVEENSVNASIYNKLALPANVTTLSVKAGGAAPVVRVQILKEDGQVDTVQDWTPWQDPEDNVYDVDISDYAGTTVTIYIQYSDGTYNGSAMNIDEVTIH